MLRDVQESSESLLCLGKRRTFSGPATVVDAQHQHAGRRAVGAADDESGLGGVQLLEAGLLAPLAGGQVPEAGRLLQAEHPLRGCRREPGATPGSPSFGGRT